MIKKILVLILVFFMFAEISFAGQEVNPKKRFIEIYNSSMFCTPPLKKDLYNDYDELYKFLDEYKNKKITINELTGKGFNYLKTKERDILENKCSKDMKSIKNNSPVVYLFHIYKHYDELTTESKRLIENSIWDASKFFNKTFTPAEINLMKSTGKFDIKNQRGEFITNAYDLIESFQLLVDNKYMNYAEAAVYMTIIASYWDKNKTFFPLKYNFNIEEFWSYELYVNQWVSVNSEKIYKTEDKHSIRMLQIFSKCALADGVYMMDISQKADEDIPTTEMIEINGKKIIIMVDKDSYDYFNSDENGAIGNKNNVKRYFDVVKASCGDILKKAYPEYIQNKFKDSVSWLRGGALGNYAMRVILMKNPNYGAANADFDKKNAVIGATITIDPKIIGKNKKDLYDALLHEFFHTCQYSYTYANSKDVWPIDIPEKIGFLNEGTAMWFESYVSSKYLDAGNIKEFFGYGEVVPDLSAVRWRHYYSFALFYQLLSDIYKNNGNPMKLMDGIFENVMNCNDVTAGLKTFKYENYKFNSYLKTLHEFNVRNFLLNKIKGIYTYEDIYAVSSNEIQIKPGLIEPLAQGIININDDSAAYRIFKNDKKIFENNVSVNFKGLSNFHAISVITKWNNEQYTTGELLINNSECQFSYYTKKSGRINPEYFVFVISSADTKETQITVDGLYISSPDSIVLSDTQAASSLAQKAGSDYYNNAKSFILNNRWKENCEAVQTEILGLIKLYESNPNDNFLLNKIKAKCNELNMNMKIAVNTVHDLRYQYYIQKNSIVKYLTDSLSNDSVLEQLKKINSYLADIQEKSKKDVMISILGYFSYLHSYQILSEYKNQDNWSKDESEQYKIAAQISDKIKSQAMSSKYWYPSNEIGNSYAAVGLMWPYECTVPISVNFPPNLKKENFAKNMTFNLDKKIINFKGINYKEYFFDTVCDPFNLKYFSIIKRHEYNEDVFPGKAGTKQYFNELKDLCYLKKIVKDFKYDEFVGLSKETLLNSLNEKIDCFKLNTFYGIISDIENKRSFFLDGIKQNDIDAKSRRELSEIVDGLEKDINGYLLTGPAKNSDCGGNYLKSLKEKLM